MQIKHIQSCTTVKQTFDLDKKIGDSDSFEGQEPCYKPHEKMESHAMWS